MSRSLHVLTDEVRQFVRVLQTRKEDIKICVLDSETDIRRIHPLTWHGAGTLTVPFQFQYKCVILYVNLCTWSGFISELSCTTTKCVGLTVPYKNYNHASQLRSLSNIRANESTHKPVSHSATRGNNRTNRVALSCDPSQILASDLYVFLAKNTDETVTKILNRKKPPMIRYSPLSWTASYLFFFAQLRTLASACTRF